NFCDVCLEKFIIQAWEIHDTQQQRAIVIHLFYHGFRTTGIWPLYTEIFREEEFLTSWVTDRALPPTVVHEGSVIQYDKPQVPRTSREAKRSPRPLINDLPYYNTTVSNTDKNAEVSSSLHSVPSTLKASITSIGETPKSKKTCARPESKTMKLVSTRRNYKKKGKTSEKESSDCDDDDCFCLVCMGPFSQSVPKKEWIQCIECSHSIWCLVQNLVPIKLFCTSILRRPLSTTVNVCKLKFGGFKIYSKKSHLRFHRFSAQHLAVAYQVSDKQCHRKRLVNVAIRCSIVIFSSAAPFAQTNITTVVFLLLLMKFVR
ncbi:unnamed protein product, partial [Acanthoscelides obtectus]